jgi:hypothetical protein
MAMMPTAKLDLLPLWIVAEQEPVGLLLRTNDVARAKAQLYRARADAGIPALAQMQIRTSPFPDGDLVLCRGPTPTFKELDL